MATVYSVQRISSFFIYSVIRSTSFSTVPSKQERKKEGKGEKEGGKGKRNTKDLVTVMSPPTAGRYLEPAISLHVRTLLFDRAKRKKKKEKKERRKKGRTIVMPSIPFLFQTFQPAHVESRRSKMRKGEKRKEKEKKREGMGSKR